MSDDPSVHAITPALEDCLEAMVIQRDEAGMIRVTDVARRLGVAKPSVTQSISRLKDLGLARQESYGHADLTPEGLVRAEDIRGRHRLLRIFLHEVLGAEPEVADHEACAIEHALSADTLARLEAFTAGFTRRTARTEGSVVR